ncbi:MAG: type II secretion system minor pseudopilin GspH [Gammaproteobacteria bacterium]|nr:type II secretion system minor pseudopilin GspH [Gammaproteobacteria bacterium]MDH3405460.1 type II secretion system minor pseudopilin GspH [Gammaproteobacteria bacterium]MDH3563473.1 type II secretion system minor pseudopilin GspH [Gammaproteobacteria bacterium]MDH5486050.1 type II secretion system minor pseudopilin GspH [Gammaproteobacteria bacterium]
MIIPRRLSGFTLIEVAVVMLVIVIILGLVTVNLNPDQDTPVRDEAHRLALLLQTAQQEAILQGKIYAVTVERQRYYFQMLDENRQFRPIGDNGIFRERAMPPDIIVSSVNIEGQENIEKPRLILLPTGELPPFTITFKRGDSRWQVEGKSTGEITAQSLLKPEKA